MDDRRVHEGEVLLGSSRRLSAGRGSFRGATAFRPKYNKRLHRSTGQYIHSRNSLQYRILSL